MRLKCPCSVHQIYKVESNILVVLKQEIPIRINLPLFPTVVPAIIIIIIAGTTVENKGKLILTEIFPSVQEHDIF